MTYQCQSLAATALHPGELPIAIVADPIGQVAENRKADVAASADDHAVGRGFTMRFHFNPGRMLDV